MNKTAFNEALRALWEGRKTFAQFARETAKHWVWMAKSLLRRWQAPEGVTHEDVTQELLLAAWSFFPRWDAKHGVPLGKYVTWNAMDKAKKWLHKQRGATLAAGNGRDRDKAPGNIATPVSRMAKDDDTANRFAVTVQPTQEAQADQAAAFRRALDRCTSVREVLALQAVRATSGNVSAAAELLYSDPEARLRCRLSCERHAHTVVARSLKNVARASSLAA